MLNTKQFDIVVVGAGPAGSTFARIAASNGLAVLLLERKSRIGIPVRCGEGVMSSGLRLFHEPRSEWISATVDNFCFVAPNGTSTTIKFQEEGYILNRKVFDNDLAIFAANEGATVVTNATVTDLIFENDKVVGVKGIYDGKPFKIKTKLVIGADGVESRIGGMAGLDTKLKLNDIDSAYQKTISGIKINQRVCYFYVSKNLFPDGYLWIFPKGKGSANIGLGISGKSAINGESAKKRLNKFIASNYPNHKVMSISVGGIPLFKPIKQMATDGIMLVGDAARTVNPLSGGGIILGMKSAARAAEVAIKVLKNGKEPSKINLFEYQKRWMKNEGKQISRLYGIKKAIAKLNDMDLNRIIEKVNKIPFEKRNLTRFFATCIPQKPSLLIDVAKVFAGY